MSKQKAETASRTETADAPRQTESGNLDRQYGNIGISAVAAALPYRGDAKNPAYARTRSLDEKRSEFETRSVLAV